MIFGGLPLSNCHWCSLLSSFYWWLLSLYLVLFVKKKKNAIFSYFLKFKNLIENQFNITVKTLQTNWVVNFVHLSFFLKILVFIIVILVLMLPNKMGELNAKIATLLKLVSMLAHSFVPISYWPYAFQYVVYLINRLPTAILSKKTLFDLLYDKSPSYSSFWAFGCSCFPFLRPLNQHKL